MYSHAIRQASKREAAKIMGNMFVSSSGPKKQYTKDNIPSSCLREKLSSWSIRNSVSNIAINELLQILRDVDVPLPKDVRTLKQTPRDAPTIPMGNGTYVHYGLTDALTDFISKTGYENENIDLDFNIDRLPIAKSSNNQIWPILCGVVTREDVLLVGVFE